MLNRLKLREGALTQLRGQVETLNRRAERHGMDALVLTIVSEGWEDTEYVYDVTIEGAAPRINGWTFVARIENNDAIGTVVRVVPGPYADEDYSAYRNHDFGCDHCETRRRRNDVFVLRNDSGEHKVVGRNCLADFLRTTDADGLAAYAQMIEDFGCMTSESLEGEFYGEGNGWIPPMAELERYLPAVAMLTRRLGWLGRTAMRERGEETCTADDAARYIWGRQDQYWRKWVEGNELYVSDRDKEKAAAAIEWAKSLEPGSSEYLHTIKQIATVGTLNTRIDGFAASIIRAYDRHLERETERKIREAGAPERVYIGKIKERLRDVPVTVMNCILKDSDWGVSTIVRMLAKRQDGSVSPIIWFASGDHDYEVGAEYKMTATVKAHDNHDRYGKQTKVNRAKLTKV